MDVDQDLNEDLVGPIPIPVVDRSTLKRQSLEIRRCGKYSPAAILHAAMLTFDEFDNKKAKKVLKMLIDDPESNGQKLLDGLSASSPVTKLSNADALGFMTQHNLTVERYNSIKKTSDQCNAKFMPCHDYVSQYKVANCRPPKDAIIVSETEAVVPLKELCIHTVDRICKIPQVGARISTAKAASGTENFKVKAIIKAGNDT